MSKPIAIIPARGGSKRLPRKNIRLFMGKPLIAWSIAAAKDSGLFSRIIVSTEDEEIAAISRSAGAEVLIRPNDYAQDRSTVVEVCLHVLETLRSTQQSVPTHLCCIYATAALLQFQDLDESYKKLMSGEFDSVMGVAEYDLAPLQALHQSGSGWKLLFPKYRSVQSQRYPELLCSAGMMYWIEAKVLQEVKTFYTDNMDVYKIPRSRLCDINTEEDLKFAELKAKLLQSGF